MIRLREFLFVLLCVCTFVRAARVCPYKVCGCYGDTLNCEKLQMIEIPLSNLTGWKEYTTLVLNTNNITRIEAGRLLPNLTILNILDNPIDHVDDEAFNESVSTLQSLSFSFANFTRIPDALSRLKTLTSFKILDTHIRNWNAAAMKNIGRTLTTLTLQNVGISTWPGWLTYFSSLNWLEISRSYLSSLPEDALDNMTSTLSSLLLNSNRLTSVPKALSNLTQLQTLYLNGNRIVDITWLPQTNTLFSLWLSNNQISSATLLSNALRPYAETLNKLDIRHNRLTSIPDLSFLTQINNFDFSHNNISDPFSGNLPINETYSLDLSYNHLPAFPTFLTSLKLMSFLFVENNAIKNFSGTDFPPTVGELRLGHNSITEITEYTFPPKSQIVRLHLTNNPITNISNLAFHNLGQLTELKLEGTKLKRLPLALQSLTSLTFLNMTASSGLVCTCAEKSLEKWVLGRSSLAVLGNCGQLSIYEFFATLSPSCP